MVTSPLLVLPLWHSSSQCEENSPFSLIRRVTDFFGGIRILIELARRDPMTGRVWFECVWVAMFAVLEFCMFFLRPVPDRHLSSFLPLGAAVALSAMGPGVMCSAEGTALM
jgi:hypothetical protein